VNKYTIGTSIWFFVQKYIRQNNLYILKTNIPQRYIWHHCMFYISLLLPSSSLPPLLPLKPQYMWLVQASAANSSEKHYNIWKRPCTCVASPLSTIMTTGTNLPTPPSLLTIKHWKQVLFNHILCSLSQNQATPPWSGQYVHTSWKKKVMHR
jgi:hypothetical protein